MREKSFNIPKANFQTSAKKNNSLPYFLAKFFRSLQPSFDVFHAGGITESDAVIVAKSYARNSRHVGVVQKLSAKIERTLYFIPVKIGNVGKHIKSTVGRGRLDAIN